MVRSATILFIRQIESKLIQVAMHFDVKQRPYTVFAEHRYSLDSWKASRKDVASRNAVEKDWYKIKNLRHEHGFPL